MSKRRALNGRVATQADQDAEEVVFYSRWPVPYRFEGDLPIRAGLVGTEETIGFPIGTEIEILQAEIGDVLIGFMVVEDEGIGLLKEIELID